MECELVRRGIGISDEAVSARLSAEHMAIDLSSVGREIGPKELWWNSSHCLLYALGVGCGPDDLAFVTENTAGIDQQVLPTFACVAGETAEFFCQRPGEPTPRQAETGEVLDLGFGLVEASALLWDEFQPWLYGPVDEDRHFRVRPDLDHHPPRVLPST